MACRHTVRSVPLSLFVMQAAKEANEALKQEMEAVKRQKAEQASSLSTLERFFSGVF